METHEFVATCDEQSVSLAIEEIEAAGPGASRIDAIGPGVLRVVHGLTFGELAAAWGEQPPIFIRHICPIHVTATLNGDESDLATLTQYVGMELTGWVDTDLPFSVQTRLLASAAYRPFAVNDAIAGLVHELSGAPLDVRRPQQVVSVMIYAEHKAADSDTEDQITALLGVSTVVQNLSDWAGGVRRFAREEGQISRSEFKLLEALDVFDLELAPRSTALDLGASPGGWTRVLRAKEIYVTAVDPGELDARLAGDRGIRFRRISAEAYLRDEPDPFDLIVNDLRMDARDSARLMVDYARYLYPHGMVIMTLKLPQQNTKRVLEHALAILADAYTVAGVRQLFHNRSEVTVVLNKKAALHKTAL